MVDTWGLQGTTIESTGRVIPSALARGQRAGKAPASVLSTGSLTPRKAELGWATRFSSLVAAPRPCGSYQLNAGNRCAAGRSAGRGRPSGPELCAQSAHWYAFYFGFLRSFTSWPSKPGATSHSVLHCAYLQSGCSGSRRMQQLRCPPCRPLLRGKDVGEAA